MPNFRRKLDFSGGVNLFEDPRQIADNEWQELKNIIPTAPGRFGTRGALSGHCLAHVGSAARGAGLRTLCIAEAPWQAGLFFSVHVDSGTTYLTSGEIGSLVTTTILTLSEQSTEVRPSFVVFGSALYLIMGNVLNYSGYKIEKLEASPGWIASPMKFTGKDTGKDLDITGFTYRPRVAFSYLRRMVYANFGDARTSYFVMSDDDTANIFDDSGPIGTQAEIVGVEGGDSIVAGVEISLSEVGTPAQRAALILKQRSGWIITGEMQQAGGDPNDSTLSIARINVDCGCAAAATLVHTPYGVIWAGDDDVWLLRIGATPIRVGTKIRSRLANTPAGARWRWTGAYFNGFYRLAVMAPGQDTDYYATCEEQWWLDLREGAPASWKEARWFGPQEYLITAGASSSGGMASIDLTPKKGADAFYVRPVEGQDAKLFVGVSAYGVFNIGSGLWTRYSIICEADDDHANSDNMLRDMPVSGISDLVQYFEHNSEIVCKATSKQFVEEGSRYKKILRGVELDLFVNGPDDIVVNAHANGLASIKTATISVTPSEGFVLGRTVLGSALSDPTARVLSDDGTRFLANNYAIELYNQRGYYVRDGYNTIQFNKTATGPFTATVAPGRYDSIYALYEAIVAAMNAVGGGTTFSHNVPSGEASYYQKPAITGSSTWCPVVGSGGVWDLCGIANWSNPEDTTKALTKTAQNHMPWSRISRFTVYDGLVKGHTILREPTQ